MSKIILSAPLTHSDWYLKTNGPSWDETGIQTMLLRCKAFGFSRIYWRVFDAGKATYASRLLEPFRHDDHEETWQYSPGYIDRPPDETMRRFEQVDYTGFDTLAAAVRIGHDLGLEIYAWMTINEDDHGLGFTSKFAREHPQYRWVRRDGKMYHSQMSFAFPDVQTYKTALVREMLAYDIDGLFIDWIRTGDIRDNPQCDADGVADYGYEQPNVESFTRQYGISPQTLPNHDERWIRCRAEPQTDFMRQVRAMLNDQPRKRRLIIMVQHPWSYRGVLPEMINDKTPQWVKNMGGHRLDGALNGLLCDIRTWARERLIDDIIATGYYTAGGDALLACDYLKNETEGRVPIIVYGWTPSTPEAFLGDVAVAKYADTNEILCWEADYIDNQKQQQRDKVRKVIARFC